MKRTLSILAVLIILAIASFLMWPRRPKAQPETVRSTMGETTPLAAPLPTATVAIDSKTPSSQREATNPAPETIVPPLMTPSAVKNSKGKVTREIADLGDGRGPVDRRFKYNADDQISGEMRLDPTTGQLIESVEYLRTDDGKVAVRITDAKGNIVFPAATNPSAKTN